MSESDLDALLEQLSRFPPETKLSDVLQSISPA